MGSVPTIVRSPTPSSAAPSSPRVGWWQLFALWPSAAVWVRLSVAWPWWGGPGWGGPWGGGPWPAGLLPAEPLSRRVEWPHVVGSSPSPDGSVRLSTPWSGGLLSSESWPGERLRGRRL